MAYIIKHSNGDQWTGSELEDQLNDVELKKGLWDEAKAHADSAHAPVNATANSTDAELRSRASHTGSQAISSITGLSTALAAHDSQLANKAEAGHGHSVADVADFSEAVRDTIAAFIVGGAGIAVTHNDAGNLLTIVATGGGGGGGGLADGDYGDLTVSGGGTVLTIDAASVTLAKLQNIAYGHVVGRSTNGTGVPELIAFADLKTALSISKADVGLSNVTNTSDANKPVSTAMQAALNLKQDEADAITQEDVDVVGDALAAHEGDSDNPHAVTQAQVGLGNVDNTSDADKPVSTATQTALGLKLDANDGAAVKSLYEGNANTNAYTDAEKSKLAGLESSHYRGTFLTLVALEAAIPAGTLGDYADVDAGLGSDVTRYIWDADDGWVLQSGAVTSETASSVKTKYESNADTNAYTDAEKAKVANVPADTATSLAAKASQASLDAHAGSTSNPHAVTKAQVGMSNADNTSDADKPVSTLQAAAIALKADATALTAHAGSTANPHAVTKAQVGLGAADNTADADKPISTATQAEFDALPSKVETLSNKTLENPIVGAFRTPYTGLIGGTASDLDSVPTAGVPVGLVVAILTSTQMLSFWALKAGTDAEDGIDVVRPDDYATTTNEKVWVPAM